MFKEGDLALSSLNCSLDFAKQQYELAKLSLERMKLGLEIWKKWDKDPNVRFCEYCKCGAFLRGDGYLPYELCLHDSSDVMRSLKRRIAEDDHVVLSFLSRKNPKLFRERIACRYSYGRTENPMVLYADHVEYEDYCWRALLGKIERRVVKCVEKVRTQVRESQKLKRLRALLSKTERSFKEPDPELWKSLREEFAQEAILPK